MLEFGPNPPSRREEDFPNTTTIPEGWSTEAFGSASANTERGSMDGRPAPQVDDETLFQRRLDPFPKPNTIPGGWDTSSM